MTGAILVIAGTARNSIIHRDMMCIAQGTSRQLGTDEPPPIDLESRDRSSDRLKTYQGDCLMGETHAPTGCWGSARRTFRQVAYTGGLHRSLHM